MESSELKRVIEFDIENARLKQIYYNLALELDAACIPKKKFSDAGEKT
jgi:hypothetical protein